ncbi:MAG: thioredoxin family protein [Nanoarchaeota archaeon]|nr:thioredoxin family protein [Nanoarchaeota archaeon]
MKITLFTSKTCVKCPAAKALVEEVAKETGAEVEYVDIERELFRALENQIASAPAIMVGNEVISKGVVPSKEELLAALKLQKTPA